MLQFLGKKKALRGGLFKIIIYVDQNDLPTDNLPVSPVNSLIVTLFAVPACPVDAVYESEEECIDDEGNDESVVKNYEFFDQEWGGQ